MAQADRAKEGGGVGSDKIPVGLDLFGGPVHLFTDGGRAVLPVVYSDQAAGSLKARVRPHILDFKNLEIF